MEKSKANERQSTSAPSQSSSFLSSAYANAHEQYTDDFEHLSPLSDNGDAFNGLITAGNITGIQAEMSTITSTNNSDHQHRPSPLEILSDTMLVQNNVYTMASAAITAPTQSTVTNTNTVITAEALANALGQQQTQSSYIQLNNTEANDLITLSPGEKYIIDMMNEQVVSRLINIENGLKLLLDQKPAPKQQRSNQSNTVSEQQFQTIKNENDLNAFETKLKTDEAFKSCMTTILKSKFGNKRSTENHTCGLELVDFCFVHDFWLSCSWAGGSKDSNKPKFAIKFHTIFRDFMKEIVRACTNAEMVTDREYQDFFKNKFKNRHAESLKSTTLKRPTKRNRLKKPTKADQSSKRSKNDGDAASVVDDSDENEKTVEVASTPETADEVINNESDKSASSSSSAKSQKENVLNFLQDASK